MSEQIDRTKYDFMFWHSSHKPNPIEGIIVRKGASNCTCGAETTDYYIPITIKKEWKDHCKRTGFGWN